LGSLFLAGTYFGHLALFPKRKPTSLPLIPLILIWGAIAIVFQSKMIGFLTSMAI